MSDNDNFAVPAPRKPTRRATSTAEEPSLDTAIPATSTTATTTSTEPPQAPPLAYEKPQWGAVASHDYGFEILKGGISIEKIQGPKKDVITIGRLPLCDIQMEHPSISRYHAVLQFNHDGNAFIYDMDSAHGTRLNKQRVPPRIHLPLRPGDQLRFGESTRICIFETDKELDEDLEQEHVRKEAKRAISVQSLAPRDQEDDEGATWGFAEDAIEEPDQDEDEESGKGKKSADADLINIAQEKMMAEEAKRRREELEIMFGDDSDEEAFYDRTARKKKKVKKVEKAETHDELVERAKQSQKQIDALEKEIEQRKQEDAAKKEQEKAAAEEEEQDLDAYMKSLNKEPENKPSVLKMQSDLNKLKKEHEHLEKLVKLTKPSDIFS
ncbi:SMAD/FHA domain-containing protein [Lichtheimia hyalospora FSU 10163]|nr:SMAD/FHA domain-containing protein [Lichtheimia hyalospora FSU 10163]